jgi:hypothetical protein
MTSADRVVALRQLYKQLDALITADETRNYPVLIHLSDLIEDLQIDTDD